MSGAEDHPVGLSIRGAVKVYPGTRALKGVDFDIRMGAVNVLVGENGAGKSTLMKVIAGVEELTEGDITVEGRPVIIRTKDDAVKAGIGIVFQELNLFPEMTVAENIYIGREPARGGIHINEKAIESGSRALMARLEQNIAPSTLVGHLRIGQQQIVEIAKALAQNTNILILDEPTSALSAHEVEVLFRIIAELKVQGVGIVYISHRLQELIRIGDYITVLRDGAITGARPMTGVDIPWIVRAMIGDKSKDFASGVATEPGPVVFEARDVCLPRPGGGWTVDHVSMTVRAGEVLGVYGLMGAGRTEFLECVMGQHGAARGDIAIDGQSISGRSVGHRIARGVAIVPEDRKRDGLVQMMSIRENLTLSSLTRLARGFDVAPQVERSKAREFIDRLKIKVASAENPVSSLSGGNQQKVVIGKALMTEPRVLLMDEPSRGIDIGAKAEIYRTIRKLAAEGLAIVFVTSDIEEVIALSDRILVMADGRVTGEFPARTEADVLVTAANPAKGRHTDPTNRETAA